MSSTTSRWLRPAFTWGVVLAYPLLMVLAIHSVSRREEGLLVLWPAAGMCLPATLLGRRPVPALLLVTGGAVAVILSLGAGDVAFGPKLAVVVAVGAVAAATPARVGVGAGFGAWAALVGAEVAWRMIHADSGSPPPGV